MLLVNLEVSLCLYINVILELMSICESLDRYTLSRV